MAEMAEGVGWRGFKCPDSSGGPCSAAAGKGFRRGTVIESDFAAHRTRIAGPCGGAGAPPSRDLSRAGAAILRKPDNR